MIYNVSGYDSVKKSLTGKEHICMYERAREVCVCVYVCVCVRARARVCVCVCVFTPLHTVYSV